MPNRTIFATTEKILPVRDLIIAASLIVASIVIAALGDILQSEYYFSFPRRRRFIGEPPSSWITLIGMLAIPVCVFWFSRRYAAFLFLFPLVTLVIGIPVGAFVFEWTPGIAHYLLMVTLASLAIFIWTRKDLCTD